MPIIGNMFSIDLMQHMLQPWNEYENKT